MSTLAPKVTSTATLYRKYLRGSKNNNYKQEIPTPIRENLKLVGFEWKLRNVIDICLKIPNYNPFLNADDYYLDLDELNILTTFIPTECIYPEGAHTGKPFIPETWQWAIFINMFCWKNKKTNLRRYREVFIYVPRKNGKTVSFGTISTLYMFYVDKEKRSQNFACAADVEQASLNFSHTTFMIEQNPEFLYRLRNHKVNRSLKSFEHANDGSTFKVLSSIAETKHGTSPNFVYIDEIHAHKNSDLIDVMVTGTAAREQSLIIYTTTADYDRPSPCNDLLKRAKAVASGDINDDSFLPVVYEASQDDKWDSIITWKKANPNFNVSVSESYFIKQVEQCKQSPELLNRFLRLHLNIKTSVETIWIPPWIWSRGDYKGDCLSINEIKDKLYEFRHWHNSAYTNEIFTSTKIDVYLEEYRSYYTWYFDKLETLRNEECYGAYDNTSVNDIASFSLYFPNKKVVLSWSWVPANSISRRSLEESVPYDRWYTCGLINNIPMDCISEIDVTNTLLGKDERIGILQYFPNVMLVCVDAWGSNFIFESCHNAGISAKKYPQSYNGMNGPLKKIEADINNYDLFHGGHPILKWQIGKAAVTSNVNQQIRLSKDKSTDKIDALVSMAMSVGGYMYSEQPTITNIPGLRDDI